MTILLIHDQSKYMAGVGFVRQRALDTMEDAYKRSETITSSLSFVNELKDKIKSDYKVLVESVENNYDTVTKYQNGGK